MEYSLFLKFKPVFFEQNAKEEMLSTKWKRITTRLKQLFPAETPENKAGL